VRRTKIGIVYERTTGQIRRLIVPGVVPSPTGGVQEAASFDEDTELAAHTKVNADEVLLIEKYSGPIDLASINAIIQLRTGKMLP
jgi:hypothetical protein